MSQYSGQNNPVPIWLPPIQLDWFLTIILIIFGANIERTPDEYHKFLTNNLIFIFGILIAVAFAAAKYIHVSFAIAFCLVNIFRLIHKNTIVPSHVPGKIEGFEPSGTVDWITSDKKWFVEKVLDETPVAIVEKEVATYPVEH
jgi:hypothetical protein